MTATALTALAIAAGGIISPAQVLLTLFLLSAPHGLRKALTYFVGYAGAYATIGVTTVLVSANLREDDIQQNADTNDVTTSMWVFIIIGVILLLLALRTAWRKTEGPRPRPKFFDKLDTLSAPKLFGLGVIVAVINVKNLTIFLTSLAVIMSAGLPKQQGAPLSVAAAFVVSIAIFGPIFVFAIGRKRAEPWLASLRDGLERNARGVSIVVLTLIGGAMLVRGIYGLVA